MKAVLKGQARQIWMRVAIAAILVGAIVTVGRWLPLYGIEHGALSEMINVCSGRTSGGMFWPSNIYVCHPAGPAFDELGRSALLGSVGLLAFLILWCRRRLTNLNNDELSSN